MREHIRLHRKALLHKNQTQQWITSPFALGIWIIVSLLLSLSLWRSMRSMQQSLSREQQEKKHLAQEEQRALDLIDKLNKADTPFAKEKIIRDELQMQKPGETVLQIPHPSP